MTDSEIIKTVRIQYTKSDDYRSIFADNALVGQAMGKAVTMDFYVGNFTPVDEIHTVTKDGQVNIKLETPKQEPYERTLQIQVVMTPENAVELVRMINERLKLFNENQTK